MAQAADSRIGFRTAAKVRCPDTSPPPADNSLAELHAWQAGPAGLAEAQIFSLGSTIADLTRLAASPSGMRLLIAALADLELIHIELGQLLSRLHAAQEIAA